jgi:transcriptional regulator with XRE-family HTH domain
VKGGGYMNLVKIGKFIAECRKAKGYTQASLAEELHITNRAVSKWENGRSLPDAAIMIELCKLLGITVTELLEGEKGMEKNEELLLQMVKEKQDADKRLLRLEWVIGILSTIIIVVPAIVAKFIHAEEWIQILVSLSGFIPGLIGIFAALRIEQVAGYYECKHCHHKHVPTYNDVCKAMHVGRTRYMQCPECGKKSWQKKVLSKE